MSNEVKCPGVKFLETTPKFRKRKNNSLCVFTSSIKRAIRKFHILVVQRWQRNVPKSVMHMKSCCFSHFDVLVAVTVVVAKASLYFLWYLS